MQRDSPLTSVGVMSDCQIQEVTEMFRTSSSVRCWSFLTLLDCNSSCRLTWLHEAGTVTEIWHFKHSWCMSLLFKQPLLMKIWVIKASGGIRSCRFDGVETKQSLLSGGHNVYRSVSDVLIRHQCRLVLVSKAHYSKVVPFSNTRLTSTSLMITDQNSFVQVPTVFLTVLLQYWYRGLKILRYIKGQITRVGYNLRK